jgi:UDP-4-amino-4,6-dideoxy-N-acetyl-beta-L-altrosamine transaminase
MTEKLEKIPYGQHFVDDDDIAAVVDVLENRFLTQGSLVTDFEKCIANYTDSRFCVSVNSGTSGLHIACLAAGVQNGDLVWTVPNSFVASANCARYCQAEVDFVDIDPETRNISLEALKQKLQAALKKNRLPKALIAVHFSGLSCDMQAIQQLIKPHKIVLIEDAAHALGAEYLGKKVGCCEYSDMTVMSFHPVKSITTAEGGAVTTNSQEFLQKLQLFSKHGVTKDQDLMSEDAHGPWYYQQVELGYNYRLSDLHAALGLSQMNKLDRFIQQRQDQAQRYDHEFSNLPLRVLDVPEYAKSAWHLYMIELTHHDRAEIYQQLHDKGVGVNVHYIPIHLQPYYANLGFKAGDFPCAESFYRNALTIPLFPAMSADEQSSVIQALREVLA